MLKNLLEGFENAVDAVSDGFSTIGDKASETAKSVSDGVKKVGEKAVKLKEEVSTNSASVEPSDILNVKESLKKVGHYKTPEWGMTDFTDNQMFEGIKSFQKKKGLKVDGIMKPDGETENALNKMLSIVESKKNPMPKKVKMPESFVPQKSELSANEQIIKQLMESAGMEYQGTIDELKQNGWKSNPNVMSLVAGETKSGGDSGSGDGEGFLAGLGEAFSKLGNMIGLGHNEGSEGSSNSDGGADGVSEAISKMGDKATEAGKTPTLSADDIKGGFDNIKEGKGVYASPEERTTGEEIAKQFPDLTENKDTSFREMSSKSGSEVLKFMTDEMSNNSDAVSKKKMDVFFGNDSFRAKVTDNGDWDHKQRIADKITGGKKIEVRKGEWQNAMNYKDKDGKLHRVVRLPGDDKHVYDHDIFSNIHYGYVGKANGTDSRVLSGGSRVNDAMKGNLKDAFQKNSKDIAAVNIGIKLREYVDKTGEKMIPELLNKFIIQNRDSIYSYELD